MQIIADCCTKRHANATKDVLLAKIQTSLVISFLVIFHMNSGNIDVSWLPFLLQKMVMLLLFSG